MPRACRVNNPRCDRTELASVRWTVRGVFAVTLLLAVLIALRYPRVRGVWGPAQKDFLYSMLLMAISTFALSTWVRKRFWITPAEQGEADPASRLPAGALMMATLGQACAVYGYAVYCFSGDTRWPWIFLLFSAGHYVQTMNRLAAFTENS